MNEETGFSAELPTEAQAAIMDGQDTREVLSHEETTKENGENETMSEDQSIPSSDSGQSEDTQSSDDGDVLPETNIVYEEVEFPTMKSLESILKNARQKQLEMGNYCKQWAEKNDCHFLGFNMKTGEPIFKEKA